ncbi:hypothetical protein PIB30_004950 [Stylosanthes scabra]|uniref:Replication factor A C-terminal domain-containing protein n=1 Tax=Stylosanthes scabra TaxID=79078 RepID=A0ABU6W1Z5_9FABA|nr:hypothetical protein [Stylosanthes scabra]
MVIILQDLENNKMNCILFGHTVDQILPYLDEGRLEPLIVLLQYFKGNRWNGKTTIQSHFDLSKVHINPDCKEVVALRSSLLTLAPSSSGRITQLSPQGRWSRTDELKQGIVVVKTVEETPHVVEEGPIWILGSIISINAGKNDWFYKSCGQCPMKVETSLGNRYECGNCDHTSAAPSISFKVEVVLFDRTGSICLLLWARETIPLCGKEAKQIVMDTAAVDDEYPAALDIRWIRCCVR